MSIYFSPYFCGVLFILYIELFILQLNAEYAGDDHFRTIAMLASYSALRPI
jgi:hypothetical protein